MYPGPICQSIVRHVDEITCSFQPAAEFHGVIINWKEKMKRKIMPKLSSISPQ
jgi:hypothetical protein